MAGDYFITDLKSSNGTRVNARSVRQRRPLVHGDKIRFGQVRVTFVLQDDVNHTATLERASGPATEPGILFYCMCGTRLWAKEEAIGGLVECGKCKRDVVVPAESSGSTDSGETVSGLAFAPPPETLSAPVQTGTCSICQWHMTTEDQTATCPACGLTFHSACWQENCGCSAYGCKQVNALNQKDSRRPEYPGAAMAAERIEVIIPSATTSQHAVKPQTAPVSVSSALLGASLVAGVIGLPTFGLPPLAVLVGCFIAIDRSGRRGAERRLMLVAATLSLVGIVAGIAISCAWWFGVKR